MPRFSAIWVATALLFAVSPLLAPGSDSRSALLSMLPFAAILAIAAIGQTLVIQQRGLDLSVAGDDHAGDDHRHQVSERQRVEAAGGDRPGRRSRASSRAS